MDDKQTALPELRFLGKVIIKGVLVARTGLHIGGSQGGMDIGGVDKIVVRDRLSGEPFVPGSSLKGKMRSLAERARGKILPEQLVQEVQGSFNREPIRIHMCNQADCEICNVFGRNDVLQGIPRAVGSDRLRIDKATPTRLIVRDARLTRRSEAALRSRDLDQLYTEVKWEVGIDRITSAANPRQMERVPAGARFGFSMAYSVLTADDSANFRYVLEAMRLLEDDYLGGLGSRGSGQVAFTRLQLRWRSNGFYEGKEDEQNLLAGIDGLGEKDKRHLADVREEQVATILKSLKKFVGA